MLPHFRGDWERIVEGKFHLPMDELLKYRHSLPRETLNRDHVKSYGEKVIANTLFEPSRNAPPPLSPGPPRPAAPPRRTSVSKLVLTTAPPYGHARDEMLGRGGNLLVGAAATAGVVALTSFVSGVTVTTPAGGQAPAGDVTTQADWTLLYAEDFSTPLTGAVTPWVWDGYSNPFDTVMDDSGLWYQNDYGPDWNTAFNSFATYRKEFRVGQNGWLTASLSARDWDKNGVIEAPPSISTQAESGGHVAVLDVPDHTGGAIFRPTNKLPPQYRIEYKLKTMDFGGKRNGAIEYDGRVNGYSTEGCKTQHPWGEGSNRPGWTGDASVPYCEWQDVREGPYGYNGFHFLSIVDFADPAPRNNHFWHYHRKVLMDSFSQHPDRVGSGTGGRVCNSNTNQYYTYRDSSFNTVNMWISGLPNWTPGPGGLAGNSQWFMTSCSGGVAERQLSSAAELQPELMPNEFYTFAIERDTSGYTLEVSGNFAWVGQKTLRFHRPFIVNNAPIWHYNSAASEYDGRFDANLVQNDAYGSTTWPNQWPAGSAYPDYFVIGDLYTNVYEGSASLTDIRLYVPKAGQSCPTCGGSFPWNTWDQAGR